MIDRDRAVVGRDWSLVCRDRPDWPLVGRDGTVSGP